jgi:hypothetical protein
VVAKYSEEKEKWEALTDEHRIGDFILGKAFKEAGIFITDSWPVFQGEEIGAVDYFKRRFASYLWCQPSVSYHHLGPAAVKDLWLFEQSWLEDGHWVRRQTS